MKTKWWVESSFETGCRMGVKGLFYVALILVLAVLGTWNTSPFLEWLDAREFSLFVRSAISIVVMGIVPAAIIIAAGIFDAAWATRK